MTYSKTNFIFVFPTSNMTYKSKLGPLAPINVSFYDSNVLIFGFEIFDFPNFRICGSPYCGLRAHRGLFSVHISVWCLLMLFLRILMRFVRYLTCLHTFCGRVAKRIDNARFRSCY